MRGLIRGSQAVVDPPALRLGLSAFVAVTLPHPRDRAAFLKVGYVKEAPHLAGKTLLVYFLKGFLKSVPGVQRTRTSIVLGTAKELATVLPPD